MHSLVLSIDFCTSSGIFAADCRAVATLATAPTPIAIQPSGLDVFRSLKAVWIVLTVLTVVVPKSTIFLTANAAAIPAAIGFA